MKYESKKITKIISNLETYYIVTINRVTNTIDQYRTKLKEHVTLTGVDTTEAT